MAEAEKQKPDTNKPATETESEQSEPARPEEQGGVEGLEPTRYGDWEKAGRCIDF